MQSLKSRYIYDKTEKQIKKSVKKEKDHRIHIRVNKDEFEYLNKMAEKKSKGNVSLYMLYCALNHKID